MEESITEEDAQVAVRVLRHLYSMQGHYIFRAASDEICSIYDFDNPEKGRKFSIPFGVIQKVVCRYFAVSLERLSTHSRKKEYNECRQIFIYLARKMTLKSTPQIGKIINRDHSTVLHAEYKIKRRFEEDAEFRKLIIYLENLIIDEASKVKPLSISPINVVTQTPKALPCQDQLPPKPNFDPPVWRPRPIRP